MGIFLNLNLTYFSCKLVNINAELNLQITLINSSNPSEFLITVILQIL